MEKNRQSLKSWRDANYISNRLLFAWTQGDASRSKVSNTKSNTVSKEEGWGKDIPKQ